MLIFRLKNIHSFLSESNWLEEAIELNSSSKPSKFEFGYLLVPTIQILTSVVMYNVTEVKTALKLFPWRREIDVKAKR